MTDRNVRIFIDGAERQDRALEMGIPQGSPVSPILFAVYIPELFGEVEQKTVAEGLSFVGDVAWIATGNAVEKVTAKLEACSAATGEWAQANAVSFDEDKTERPSSGRAGRTKIQVGNSQVATTRRQRGGWECISTARSHHRTQMRKVR